MSSILKRGACAAIIAIVAATSIAPAVAGPGDRDRDRYVERYYRDNPRDEDYRRWRDGRWDRRDYDRWYRRHHSERNNDNAAAAIFGLAAGALAAGAAANSAQSAPQQRSSRVPSAGGHEAFSAGYMRYCSNKYRSFDPDTGTFRGNDGRDHYCQ